MDYTFKIIAIGLYFAAMLAIGFYAARNNSDLDDYMLAGRRMRPSVAALSAGASDMSGWLLLGLPGAVYAAGLVEAWIAIGLTVGAWLNWKFVAPRLRAYTEVARNSITIPSFLENRFRDRTRVLRIVAGLVILVFFTFYVSSGMVSGGKFFESSFGSTYLFGMFLVAGITIVYTLFGGFLGASLTDVVQGLMMLAALVAVPVVAIIHLGGWGEVVSSIQAADAAGGGDRLSLLGGATVVGVASALAWGLGYFGQPHIIVRFMALRSAKDAVVGRRIGIAWMAICALGAIMTALVGIAYVQANPGMTLEDPETVFLALSQVLFHPLVAGLVLAAVLAAVMSTISSQLIVCSSALVEDLYKLVGREASPRAGLWLGRTGVVVVSVVALLLALDPESSVLELVAFAWAGFGASFGPIVILSLFWRRFNAAGAITALVVGTVVVFWWGNMPDEAWGGTFALYEIVPGFVLAAVAGIAVSLATHRRDPEIDAEFDEAVAVSRGAEPAERAVRA
ncbi:sodium/proline symporter PutP [Citricoccus sp. SGAir0253]|uniref:sodium/proline symporter PutP n=1 Tax=Citricoccus sp. SGAir0253 TaxID=2567881 RepID=UPI0010CD3C1C|nr:sodium/proline symporter PutP [Citricoccus sp. SGAir0253]QCU78431.1 sodium/proline symporter PutP [Citricoccus sp. SGAir0253]